MIVVNLFMQIANRVAAGQMETTPMAAHMTVDTTCRVGMAEPTSGAVDLDASSTSIGEYA